MAKRKTIFSTTCRERGAQAEREAIQRHGKGTPRYWDFMRGREDHERKYRADSRFGRSRKPKTRPLIPAQAVKK